MLKNKAWIVALLAALAMAFIGFGCTEAGLDFSPPEPDKGEYENIELGPVGWKGGQPGNQQGWYSIGYQDDGLLGTPVATVEQFVTAKYLVVRLVSSVPAGISGETSAIQVIWGGDGAGWQTGTNITVSTADEAAIRYDAETNELWVDLSKALSMYSDYAALKTGARLVLQCWGYSDAYESAYLVVPTDPSSVEPPSVVVPTTYIVPKSGGRFFYLNLNDYQTEGAVNGNVPDGELTKTSLTLLFTENDQRANFPLTEEQVELISTRKEGTNIKVTVVGTATALGGTGDSTTPFRYHLGNAKSGSSWNATSTNTQGPFSGANYNAEKELTFTTEYEITDALLGYFILQQRAAAETEVVIKSIKIGYTPDLDPVVVTTEATKAFPTGVTGGNGPTFVDNGVDWFVMAMRTYGGSTNQPAFDYNSDSSGASGGANAQQYPSEIRAKFSDFSDKYALYDKVKITVIARELTTAELTAKGWTAQNNGSSGDLAMAIQRRNAEFGGAGNFAYPDVKEAEKGSAKSFEYNVSQLAAGGEWDGFIISFNDWQWIDDGKVSPFIVRVTKIEFYFDD
jgi:hypothetical protein